MSITSSNVSRDGVFNSMGRKDPSVIAFANNLSGSAKPIDHPRSMMHKQWAQLTLGSYR